MILLFLLSFFFNHAEANPVGRVIKTSGEGLEVIRLGEKISLKEEMELLLKDTIKTNQGIALIQLFPATQLSLGAGSEFTVVESEIEAVEEEEFSKIIVDFVRGQVKVLVKKLNESDETEQTIRAQDLSVGIRGTELDITIDENQDTTVEVLEGQVEAKHENESALIGPNESLEFRREKLGKRLMQKRNMRLNRLRTVNLLQPLSLELARSRWREKRRNFIKKNFSERLMQMKRRKQFNNQSGLRLRERMQNENRLKKPNDRPLRRRQN